jgi:hypothetical protein
MIRTVPTPPITPLRPPPPRPRARRAPQLLLMSTGVALVGLALGAAWFSRGALEAALDQLDAQALGHAGVALDKALDSQRGQALSQIRLLADDNRVRATVITPRFDEATVRDVLDDLRKASGASVMAVLDVAGKVGAVSGIEALKKENLGQTAAVKAAMEKATADVWTFPDRVLVIAVAPIISGNQVAALMVIGFELGSATLGAIEQASGVSAALVVSDKVVARGSSNAALTPVFEAARAVAEGTTRTIDSGGTFLVRASRTTDSAAAARALWLVPRHQQAGLFRMVPQALWIPALSAVAMLLLSIAWSRR